MRAQQKGFTLIELMIVVAIIAILASVAYPAYIRHVVKARRVAAASCMMEMAQFAERYYTTNMKYSGLALPNAACMQEVGDHYTIASVAGDLTDTTFTLTATPKGGQAAKDTSCGTLQIDQKGTKSVTGSDSSQPGRCF